MASHKTVATDSDNLKARIMQGDIELVSGSINAVRVIYRNMTGQNFKGKELEDYLAGTSRMLQCEIRPELLTFEMIGEKVKERN
jgi:hypothetical protein